MLRLHDPEPFCLWSFAVLCQVFENTKHSIPIDAKLWNNNFTAYACAWILVFKSGLGSRGAALANSVSCWINVLLLAFCAKFASSCAKTWTGFSKEALNDIFAYLQLAISSAAMPQYNFSHLDDSLWPEWRCEELEHPESARLAVCIGLILTITEGIVEGIVLVSICNKWGYAYSRDTEVVTYVATMNPILAASTFIDARQCVLSGLFNNLCTTLVALH
ncbi:hypothetical protein Pint_16951 [Pistacia integerrima]|uniref:Uncharacterized protein n=1 Tax=Pistacia integerrima TaxID=434235 RepID=A0ACC0ZCH0_9ROSI|nr:hypothetical protein Pint_16951 [Pistacia integerrima]